MGIPKIDFEKRLYRLASLFEFNCDYSSAPLLWSKKAYNSLKKKKRAITYFPSVTSNIYF